MLINNSFFAWLFIFNNFCFIFQLLQVHMSFTTSEYVFDKTSQDAKMTSQNSSFQDLEDIDFAQISSNPGLKISINNSNP